MDPTSLPEVVVEHMFRFLPVKDLLKCSVVNSIWRDAVNKNIIWKQHCSLPISYENIPCKVLPVFQPPMNSCLELSPLCRYRIHYMRQIHLQNNFLQNRYVEHRLSRTYDKFAFIGKYLIVNNPREKVFEVWDIKATPDEMQVRGVEVPCSSRTTYPSSTHPVRVPYLLNHTDLNTFQVVNDSLLIVQCNLLQVCYIDNGIVSLKFCRIFDREEKLSETIPCADSISSWHSSIFKVNPEDFRSHNEVVGNVFVGIVESPNLSQSVMHIWDLESGSKLKEEKFAPLQTKVNKIVCGKNSQFLYIIFYLIEGRSRCKIVCYSLKTLQFTQFYEETDQDVDSMLCGENVVVLSYCQDNDNRWGRKSSLMILDGITGHRILVKTNTDPINSKQLDLHKDLLVYRNGYTTISVMDLSTFQEVSCLDIQTVPTRVYLLDNNMLLVGRFDYCEDPIIEIWDLFKKRVHYWWDNEYIVPCERSLVRVSSTHRNSWRTLVYQYW